MMKKFIVRWLLVATVAFVISPFAVKADTISDLQAQMAQLLQMVSDLQAKLAAQSGNTPSTNASPVAWCHTFNQSLRVGNGQTINSGPTGLENDISALYLALGKYESLFNYDTLAQPGSAGSSLRTTYFDEQLASYVSKFQEKYASEILTPNGLSNGTGFVGASTRAKLNRLYGCNPSTPYEPPVSPVVCTMDAQQCSDGSYTYRVPPNCAFKACPGSSVTLPVDLKVDTQYDSNSYNSSGFVRASIGSNSQNSRAVKWKLAVTCSDGVSMLASEGQKELCNSDYSVNSSGYYGVTSDYLILTSGVINRSGTQAQVGLALSGYDANGASLGGDKEFITLASGKGGGYDTSTVIISSRIAQTNADGTEIDYTLTPSSTTKWAVTIVCQSPVTASAKGGGICGETTSILFGSGSSSYWPVWYKNPTNTYQTVGIKVQAYDSNGNLIGSDSDAVTIPPTPNTSTTLEPHISTISPTSGPVGTTVTVTGRNMSKLNTNRIFFKIYNSASSVGNVGALYSPDGNSLTFQVPTNLSTGMYVVSVWNTESQKESNQITFNVTAGSTAQPSITVISPNNSLGGPFKAGDTLNVSWSTKNFGLLSVSLDLVYDNKTIAQSIASNITNSGSYSWVIPTSIRPGNYYLMASSFDRGPSAQDFSDYYFTINSPSVSAQSALTVISPNGGTWQAGQSYSIQWKGASNTGYSVFLSGGGNGDSYARLIAATNTTGSADSVSVAYYRVSSSDISSTPWSIMVCPSNTTPGNSLCGRSANIYISAASTETCNYSYSDWSACTSSGTQSRSVTAATPAGCSGGTVVLAQSCTYTPSSSASAGSLQFSLVSKDWYDYAGMWGTFGPGKASNGYTFYDWEFLATINLDSAKTIKSIDLSDGSGTWSTSDNAYYPLVVFKDGAQLNTAYKQNINLSAGSTNLKLYAQIESSSLGVSRLTVTFTDGTTLTASGAGSVSQNNSTSNMAATLESVRQILEAMKKGL